MSESTVSPAPHGRRTFVGVQGLRALAALMVVAYHAVELWSLRPAPPGQPSYALAWPNGSAGVDLFFVISGFVMTIAARTLSGWRDAGRFAAQRLARIVPLYWIFSALKIAAVLAIPALALRTRLGAGYVAASFLFLPVHDGAGDFKPVLPVGWTLTFEMMFYALFACAIGARLRPAIFVLPALVVIAALPHTPGSVIGELCNPIVLEFGFGMLVGLGVLRGWTLAPRIAWLLLAVALAILLAASPAFPGGRVLGWGVPAGVVVACVVALEPWLAPALPKLVTWTGDASYAIYLTHGFVIPVLAVVLKRVPHTAPWAAAWIALVLTASTLTGLAVHVVLERPITRWFKSRRRRAAVAGSSVAT